MKFALFLIVLCIYNHSNIGYYVFNHLIRKTRIFLKPVLLSTAQSSPTRLTNSTTEHSSIIRTLLIDNFDSYTYNIFQLLSEVNGVEPIVVYNNAFDCDWDKLLASVSPFDNIVLSPGPGHPYQNEDFGICLNAIKRSADDDIPLLGICLGHQGLAYAYGGEVIKAKTPMHGRLSKITHHGQRLFKNVNDNINVVRYHSLIAKHPLPPQLKATAWTSHIIDNIQYGNSGIEIMALEHVTKHQYGVQFHPESIKTEAGKQLFENFRDITIQHIQHNNNNKIRQNHNKQNGILSQVNSYQMKQNISPLSNKIMNTKTKMRQISILSYKNTRSNMTCEQVFEKLYGHSSVSFWLDSESKGAINHNNVDSTNNNNSNRFSYFGALDTFHSNAFEYYGNNNLIKRTFRFPNNNNTNNEHESENISFSSFTHQEQLYQNIFEHLRELLDEEKETNNNYYYDYYHDNSYNNMNISLPINITSTLFGYLGYELDYIKDGITYETCLTMQFSGRKYNENQTSFNIYKTLRRYNPAPYACYIHYHPTSTHPNNNNNLIQMKSEGFSICSSSPECYLKITTDGLMKSKPIKGTARRDLNNPIKDKLINEQLSKDEKSQAENLMIVDLVRNDFGRVCVTKSVTVPKLMDIETFATVHQMVSTITGKLDPNKDIIDAIIATFPGGSMTGAPKIKTMQIIKELENNPRGIYSGGIGYIGLNGILDLNIVIRTALVLNNTITIGSGGAIVALSDPEQEVQEVILKAQSVGNALGYTIDFPSD
eukprot:gene4482-6335_t